MSNVRLGTNGRVWQQRNLFVLTTVSNMRVPGQVIPGVAVTAVAESIRNAVAQVAINGVVRPALKNPVLRLINILVQVLDTVVVRALPVAANIQNVIVKVVMNGKTEVVRRKL